MILDKTSWTYNAIYVGEPDGAGVVPQGVPPRHDQD